MYSVQSCCWHSPIYSSVGHYYSCCLFHVDRYALDLCHTLDLCRALDLCDALNLYCFVSLKFMSINWTCTMYVRELNILSILIFLLEATVGYLQQTAYSWMQTSYHGQKHQRCPPTSDECMLSSSWTAWIPHLL